jgi:o-succinylbenzoate synthase
LPLLVFLTELLKVAASETTNAGRFLVAVASVIQAKFLYFSNTVIPYYLFGFSEVNSPKYQLKCDRDRRHFLKTLQTSHGIWKVRESIILCLRDDLGKVGCGEIAPIPWFGSETIEDAWDFCQHLGGEITREEIETIPDRLSACQFGFESALEDIDLAGTMPCACPDLDLSYSYLLPAGETALNGWQASWEKGGKTFKWKIGVKSFEEEIEIFQKLIRMLPGGIKLRLDANGGLSLKEAHQWLKITDEIDVVEFIEQPLSPQQFDRILDLSNSYKTTIALDESVANIVQLTDCYRKGWRGVYVIKAAIAGSPKRLRQFIQQHQIDAVFSSVFETEVGRKAALRLAAELSNPNRAVGFGVNSWF